MKYSLSLLGILSLPLAVFPNLTRQMPYQATRSNYSLPRQIRWKQIDDRNKAISKIGNRHPLPIKPYVNPLEKIDRPSTGGGDGTGFTEEAWDKIRYFGSGVTPPDKRVDTRLKF